MFGTEQIKHRIGGVADKAKTVVRGAADRVRYVARSAVDTAKGVAHDAVDRAKDVAHDAVDKAREIARSAAQRVNGKAATEQDAAPTLVIERELAASPYQVYKAWTDPSTLATWWGPEGFKLEDYTLDVEPSGHYRVRMVAPNGERFVCSGVYRELVPNERVVFTFAWEADGKRGHETEITVTFEHAGKTTRMRFVQQPFESVEQRDRHRDGWTSSFNQLSRVVES